MLGKPQEAVNLVICHLGAGSSMCAIQVSERCGAGWAGRQEMTAGAGRLGGNAGAGEGSVVW
jgi:butyrate kinase